MKKLLLYGGTFDPPHSGHVHLLRHAMRGQHYDPVYVMPTALPPHKTAHHFLSDEKRLGALKMLFSGVHVSDFEMRKGGKSYSVDTLRYLHRLYPEHQIYMLIGSDMFWSIEKWYRFEEILSLCTLLAAPRQPDERQRLQAYAAYLTERYGARCEVLHIPLRVLSSTEIRAGKIDAGLPLEVRCYLYGENALEPLYACLKREVTEAKYEHTLRVAEYADKLALLYGADRAQVKLAALLHDITKCWDREKQLAYLKRKRCSVSPQDRRAPQILHQITGSLFAAEKFHIKDKMILQAIACHTTGRERMNTTDKILFLADSIEMGRDYAGVETMRAVSLQNLDKAVLMNFDRLITYIIERGFYLHPQTVAARNWLLRKLYLEEKQSGKQ